MSKILTETSREVNVKATATSGAYTYEVNYTYNQENQLASVTCNLYQTHEGSRQYMGYMSLAGGVKNLSFNPPADADILSHVTLFEQMLDEIGAGIATQGGEEAA